MCELSEQGTRIGLGHPSLSKPTAFAILSARDIFTGRDPTFLLAMVGSDEDLELLETRLLVLQSAYRTSQHSNSSCHAWLLLTAYLRMVAPSENRKSSLATKTPEGH